MIFSPAATPEVTAQDLNTVAQQLDRAPRGVVAIAYRTPSGIPAVVTTGPRLPSGEPFPTLYYLTEPGLVSFASRLESLGVMRALTRLVQEDSPIRERYVGAHQRYLAERNALADLGTEFSGGGMPDRVKCLHVLIAHSLAAGPNVNPIGDLCLGWGYATGQLDGLVAYWPAIPAEFDYIFNTESG